MAEQQVIGFGGGCHWCTEAVFQSLRGVLHVKQGYIRSHAPDDGYSEAVEVLFDPTEVSVESLVSVHLSTHASTSLHSMRNKYRSAIYTSNEKQQSEADAALSAISKDTGLTFVTRVLPNRGFEFSKERFHNYRANNPDRPFCKVYIEPKLASIRKNFPALIHQSDTSSIV